MSSGTDIKSSNLKNGAETLPSNGSIQNSVNEQDNPQHHDIISDSKLFRGAETEYKYKKWLRFEIVGLIVVILVVWGLFTLPIVFYHLPVDASSTSIPTSVPTLMQEVEMCSSVVPYEGGVCHSYLQSMTDCLPSVGEDGGVLVQSDATQILQRLLPALDHPLLAASDECKAAVVPFLCVHFFSLCDSTGRAYRHSSSQCEEITAGVCAREWAIASGFSATLGVQLPDCATFPNETVLTGMCNGEDNSTDETLQPSQPSNETCTCGNGFYCKEGTTLCSPQCGSWEQYDHRTTVAVDVTVILSAVIGIISAVAVLVIGGIRWKKVFVFPMAFVIYETIGTLAFASFVLITYFDREGLYCSSPDLIESARTATPFCIISGIVFEYVILQLVMWWIFHIAALFWKIQFPFLAHRANAAHLTRYIHLVTVILGLLVPILPIIITIADDAVQREKLRASNSTDTLIGELGFGYTRFPPILCATQNSDILYYSILLPVNVLLIIGMTILVIIFWTVHKQHGLFKARQSKNPFKIGTAERKILIVFCYYVVVTVISLVGYTISIRSRKLYSNELFKYFLCEQAGSPDMHCSREDFEKYTYPILLGLSYILVDLFPVINLLFVVNCTATKKRILDCFFSKKP